MFPFVKSVQLDTGLSSEVSSFFIVDATFKM